MIGDCEKKQLFSYLFLNFECDLALNQISNDIVTFKTYVFIIIVLYGRATMMKVTES